MNIEYSCKFHGDKDYEMYEMVFKMDDSELGEEFANRRLQNKMLMMQSVLITQGLLLQEALGYIDTGTFSGKLDQLKKSILTSLLNAGVKK